MKLFDHKTLFFSSGQGFAPQFPYPDQKERRKSPMAIH
jgi:hypothetical protein